MNGKHLIYFAQRLGIRVTLETAGMRYVKSRTRHEDM